MARRLGVVHVFAARAVELHGLVAGDVRETHGEEMLRGAEDAGTFSKIAVFIFFALSEK